MKKSLWTHPLRVIATIVLLMPEAHKFINGQNLTVLTPHGLSGILNTKVQSDNGSIFKAAAQLHLGSGATHVKLHLILCLDKQ